MQDKEDIKEHIEKNGEVSESGGCYIIRVEYEDREFVAHGKTRFQAKDALKTKCFQWKQCQRRNSKMKTDYEKNRCPHTIEETEVFD